MLRNYFTIALRNLRKHKGYALINVLGLAGSTAVSILMLLYAYNVLTFDQFHEHADDVYFLYRTRPVEEGAAPVYDTWAPMLEAVLDEYPAVVEGMRTMDGRAWVQAGDKRFSEQINYVDPSLFSMFDFSLVRGDPATALAGLESVVLTEAAAEKYFGDADPLGQTLTLDFDRTYTVTGVLADVPPNSSFTFNIIAPLESLPFMREADWTGSFLFTFVRLAEGADPTALEAQFPAFVDKFFIPSERGGMKLLPLKEVNDVFFGQRRYAYILLAIALGILLIACINFTNLSTARSMLRGREIGMRKVLGATRGRLVAQFLGESLLMSFLALLAGTALAELLLPLFNGFVGMDLALNFIGEPVTLGALLGLGLVVGLVSGSYPAFFLSRFRPLTTLKAGYTRKPGGGGLRNGLVVVQFALSVMLLIGIGVIYQQIGFMKAQDLRFDEEDLLVLPVSARDFAESEGAAERIDAFRHEIAQLSGVRAVAATNSVPGRYGGSFTLAWPEGREDENPLDWRYAVVDDHYFDTFGMTFVEGRTFSRERGTDEDAGLILNEAALRELGWDTARGKKLVFGSGNRYDVIGVVEDFHYQSLQQPIEPVIHFYGGQEGAAYRFLAAKLAPGATAATLSQVETAWKTIDPTRALDYFFVGEFFDTLYRTEEDMARIVAYAAGLALLIACLGLLGLASFTVVQRTKEIGVRKVLGARVWDVVALLSRQFARPVLLAIVLAMPAGYFLMDRWLQAFPYQVGLSWLLFAGAGLAALLVALGTVSYHAVRAALTDPVEALRYE